MKSKKTIQADMDTLMPLLIGVWRRFHKLAGPSDILQTREFRSVVMAVQNLLDGLESGTSLVGTDYLADREILGAYLLYFWVIHYQQALSLLNEIPTTSGNGISRVLDLASGPGAFSFAALKHGACDVTAIDHNASALTMAGEICGRHGYPLTVRQHNVLKFPYPIQGKFDLIIIGHCLEELFPSHRSGWQNEQRHWIEQVHSLLSPQGYLLFVESSQAAPNRRMLELRNTLVNSGFPVQAPCVWRGQCPALLANNQCYAQRDFEKTFVIKEIQRSAKINLSSLKMSYLLVKHQDNKWPTLPDIPLYRVISRSVETFAGKRYHLCGTDGKRDLGSHLKEQTTAARAFDFLKRGELISIHNGLLHQNHIDIIANTEVKIQAALGKALPYN